MTRQKHKYGDDLRYYSADYVVVSTKNGKNYTYEEFKTIYDMCHALIEADIASKDACHILMEFRIVVPDNK